MRIIQLIMDVIKLISRGLGNRSSLSKDTMQIRDRMTSNEEATKINFSCLIPILENNMRMVGGLLILISLYKL
jgi:hypothetical protein